MNTNKASFGGLGVGCGGFDGLGHAFIFIEMRGFVWQNLTLAESGEGLDGAIVPDIEAVFVAADEFEVPGLSATLETSAFSESAIRGSL